MMDQLVNERDEALLSLDKKKIMRYAAKYGITMLKHELALWAGIHKAILQNTLSFTCNFT